MRRVSWLSQFFGRDRSVRQRKRKRARSHGLIVEPLEVRVNPAEVAPLLNVALISDAVAQAEQVRMAAAKDTIAIIYQSATATTRGLVDVLASVSEAHNGARIEHLALVTHGSPGQVVVGKADSLTLNTLPQDAMDLQRFHALLTVDARFDLYACSVASGATGKLFVDQLAAVTGADVYASDNGVGSGAAGDFVWEYHTGQPAVSSELLSDQKLELISGLSLPAPTASWSQQPPSSITAGQTFQVAWTTTGSPTHVNIHWNPNDPTVAGTGGGPGDTTDSSTFTPTSSPTTLTAPIKNADGSTITVPTTVKYVVHVSNSSGSNYSTIVSVTVNPATTAPTASWSQQPPSSITAGQTFQVAWTTTGSPTHVNIHWNPNDPTVAGTGGGPGDTTDSSTFTPTSSPTTLTAPIKNADGSTITVPTTVKYVVHVSNSSGSNYSTIVSVTVNPATTAPTASWSQQPPSSITAGQTFQVAWTTTGSPTHVNIHWNPNDPTVAGTGGGPGDTTDSSTFTPTSSPTTLTAPIKNADGSTITVPTTVKYVVHVSNSSGSNYSTIVSVTVNPATTAPTASWSQQPPSSITAGQTFQVAWTTTGSPTHVNIHWNPNDPTVAGTGGGPGDTTDSSTFTPTSSPTTLTAPIKNADGSTITVPTTVKYVVHVSNSSGSNYSTIVSVTVNPATTAPTLPSTIRVLRTASGTVDTVDFETYVKNVLPNEWGPVSSFADEALRAGAMAVKTYAWYWTIHQKYPGLGYDVKDTTADQVYVPGSSNARTNQAVIDTWFTGMLQGGVIFESQYDSGTPGSPNPLNPGRLSQWGTEYWAEQGKDYRWILANYYPGVTIGNIANQPPDQAGNTLSAANPLGALSTSRSVSDWVGNADSDDYYRFDVATTAPNWNVHLLLSNLNGDADVQLLNATGEILWNGTNPGTADESHTLTLGAGTYYVRVFPGTANANVNYTLKLDATPILAPDAAGNTMSTARKIGMLSTAQQFVDWVGASDTNDYYQFSLSSGANWNYALSLSGLGANADVQLLDNAGSPIWVGSASGTTSESDSRVLNPGNYFVRVYPGASGNNTNYTLRLDASKVNVSPDQKTIFDAINFNDPQNAPIASQIKGFITGFLGTTWDKVVTWLDDRFEFFTNTTAGFKFGFKADVTEGLPVLTVDIASVGWGMSVEYNSAEDTWKIARGFESSFKAASLAGDEFLVIPGDYLGNGRPITAGIELTGGWNLLPVSEIKVGLQEGIEAAVGRGSEIGPSLAVSVETSMSQQEFLTRTDESTVSFGILDSFGFIASSWWERAKALLGKWTPLGRPTLAVLGQSDDPLGLLVGYGGDIQVKLQQANSVEGSLSVNLGVAASGLIGVSAGVYGKAYATSDVSVLTVWSHTYHRADLTLSDDVGNTRTTASSFVPRQTTPHTLGTNDRDVFAFQSSANQSHEFSFTNTGIPKVAIVVRDGGDNVLRRVTASDTGTTIVSVLLQDQGQYYLSIEGTPSNAAGSYTVNWSPGSPDGTFNSGTTGYDTLGGVYLVSRGLDGYASQLQEHSPANLTSTVTIPQAKPTLSFAYRMIAPGDGDEMQVRVKGTVVWSRPIDSAQSDFVFAPAIDLSAYAGQTVELQFGLLNVGAANAAFEVDDITLQASAVGPQIGVTDSSGDASDRDVSTANTAVGSTSNRSIVTLLNSGDQRLNITSFARGGGNPGDFEVVVRDESGTVVSGNNFAIAPGKAYAIEVRFKPTAAGYRSLTITFNTDAADAGDRTIVLTVSGKAPATLAPGVPFADGFNRIDNAFLGAGWSENVGDVAVVANRILGKGAFNVASLNGVSVADVIVQADVNVAVPGRWAGLVARYSGTGDRNMYWAVLVHSRTGYEAWLWKNVNGVWTALVAKKISSTGSGRLRFEVIGSSLKLFLNNTLVAFANDTALTAPGTVGVRVSANATVDNFDAKVRGLANARLPFGDAFSTAIDQQLSSKWFEWSGNFKVASGFAKGSAALNVAVVNGVSSANVTVAANVNVTGARQSAGLIARYSGISDSNMYLAMLVNTDSGYQAWLWRRVNSNWTALVVKNVVSTGTGRLRFEVVGSSLKLFLNNALVAFANDTALSPGGTVGMRVSANAAVDNFNAEALNMPFADAFSTSTGQQLSSNWQTQLGAFQVVGGLANGVGGLNLAVVNNTNTTDVMVTADVIVGAGQQVGLVARYGGSGDQNMYVGRIVHAGANQYVVQLVRNINGVWTILASRTIGGHGTGRLRLAVQGTKLSLFFNSDVPLITAVDSALTPGTVGLRISAGASIENFAAG